MFDKDGNPVCAKDPLERILQHAYELRWKDYRGDLANWQRDYELLMSRKPKPPKNCPICSARKATELWRIRNKHEREIDHEYWT